ncbi:MAG: VanZ family protein [Halochromatium sp.]|uniref:VanZ family protein n=1 Tax=Halochromatium sp. TaxID=2049430 RepID=UPI00397C0AB7
MVAAWLFALTCLGIVYGSLYPFGFRFEPIALEYAVGELLREHRYDGGIGNVLANVVLFLPYGLFGALALVRRTRWLRWAILIGGGAVLAFGIQVLQLWLPPRVPAVRDGLLNMVGLVLGGLLAAVPWWRLQREPRSGEDGVLVIPAMLIACWVAYKWFPFVPTLDWYTIKQGLKPLWLEPRLEWLGVLRNGIGWLVVAALWRDCRLPARWFWIFLPTVVFAQVGIAHNPLALDGVIGAALALPAWWLLSRVTYVPAAPVLLGLIVLVVLQGLHPFVPGPSSFVWVPLQGFLTGSMGVNLLSLLFKLFLYGSLVWLVFRVTGRAGWALGLPVVLVLLVEIAQTRIAGRVAEITDPLLCLLIGALLWLVLRSQQSGATTLSLRAQRQ